MVEYYDSKKKALINITYKKRKPNIGNKKRFYKQRASELGQLQRDALNKMVFIRSMATKDPQFAPLDMQGKIIAARAEEQRLNALINNFTKAIQAATTVSITTDPKDEKEYMTTSTQADMVTLEDILMTVRQQIGAEIFDKAVINHTKKERLKLLNDINPTFNIFTPSGNIRDTRARELTGIDTSINIGKLYSYFTSDVARQQYPILNQYEWLRRDFTGKDVETTE